MISSARQHEEQEREEVSLETEESLHKNGNSAEGKVKVAERLDFCD